MVKMKKKIIVLVIVSMFLLTGLTALSAVGMEATDIGTLGDTIYVHPGESIQDAIDVAKNGDTIYVYSGTYKEHLNIKKSITLIGEDREETTIDGGGSGTVVCIKADGVTVQDFAVINGNRGFSVRANDVNIEYNIVSSHIECGIFFGEFINDPPKFYDNVAKLNIISDCDMGIYTWMVYDHLIAYNIIYGCFQGIAGGEGNTHHNIYFNTIQRCAWGIQVGSSNHIYGNIVDQCYGGGMLFWYSKNNIVEGNLAIRNEVGIETNVEGHKNTFFHNSFIDNDMNVDLEDEGSTWYNSDLKHGNYWDDYNGVDEDGDGIGDTPYDISGECQDIYPLMERYDGDNALPTIEIIKPENAIYYKNEYITPFQFPFIIGPIDVEAYAFDADTEIDRVEFYTDGDLKNTDFIPNADGNYVWHWDELACTRTKISSKAYDHFGNSNSYKMTRSALYYNPFGSNQPPQLSVTYAPVVGNKQVLTASVSLGLGSSDIDQMRFELNDIANTELSFTYFIDFGDGTTKTVTLNEPYCSLDHEYNNRKCTITVEITANVKIDLNNNGVFDEDECFSLSETVQGQKTRSVNLLRFTFLQKLLEQFPLLQHLLQYFLQRLPAFQQ